LITNQAHALLSLRAALPIINSQKLVGVLLV
jgi:hypothetical protein